MLAIAATPTYMYAAYQDTQNTAKTQQEAQQQLLYTSGKILNAANSHYVIQDANGKNLAKGYTDANGVFFDEVPLSIVKTTELALNIDGKNIESKVIPSSPFVIFNEKLFADSNENSDMPPLLFAFIQDGYVEAAVKSTFFVGYAKDSEWGLFDLLSGVLSTVLAQVTIGEEEKYDYTKSVNQRLDKLLAGLDALDKKIVANFNELNDRVSEIFEKKVSDKMLENTSVNALLSSYLELIINILSSEKYHNFWDTHPEYVGVDSNTDMSSFWQSLAKYDKDNNLSRGSLTQSLNIIKNNMDDANNGFAYQQQVDKVESLYKDADNIYSQEQLQNYIENLNNRTLNVTIDSSNGYKMNVCDGSINNIKYSVYSKVLANLYQANQVNNTVLEFFDIANSNDKEFKEALFDLLNITKSGINNCSFFGSTKAQSIPGVTYLPVLNENKPYLFVEVAILESARELLYQNSASELIKNDSLKSQVFSVLQNKFLDALDSTYAKVEKIAYNSDNSSLVAYYRLSNMSNIDINIFNDSVFADEMSSSEDGKVVSKYIDGVSCYYGSCTIELSNIPEDNYTLNFGLNDDVILKKGYNKIQKDFGINDSGATKTYTARVYDTNDKLSESQEIAISAIVTPENIFADRVNLEEGSLYDSIMISYYYGHTVSGRSQDIYVYYNKTRDMENKYYISSAEATYYYDLGMGSEHYTYYLTKSDGHSYQVFEHMNSDYRALKGEDVFYDVNFTNGVLSQTAHYICHNADKECSLKSWSPVEVKPLEESDLGQSFQPDMIYTGGDFSNIPTSGAAIMSNGTGQKISWLKKNANELMLKCPTGYGIPNAVSKNLNESVANVYTLDNKFLNEQLYLRMSSMGRILDSRIGASQKMSYSQQDGIEFSCVPNANKDNYAKKSSIVLNGVDYSKVNSGNYSRVDNYGSMFYTLITKNKFDELEILCPAGYGIPDVVSELEGSQKIRGSYSSSHVNIEISADGEISIDTLGPYTLLYDYSAEYPIKVSCIKNYKEATFEKI